MWISLALDMESRIFRGQRSIGCVCNEIPLQSRYIKKHRDTFIITAVGKKFHTYSASKLHLYSTSEFHPSDIQCLASDARYVYTACQDDIRVFKRGVHAEFVHPVKNVRLLHPFGDFLVAVTGNTLVTLERDSGKTYLEIPFPKKSFNITCLSHPATYVNKILIGSEQGPLQLWNLHSACKLYEFSGWNSAVTCIEQAPALDVMAVGLKSGYVYVHNIKTDLTLMKFYHDWGEVTGLAFRTDGPPLLISGSHLGHLVVWNLESQRLVSLKENAHLKSVTGIRCFPSEPIIVTSSPDNSIRIWIMDDEIGSIRLLKCKEGHSASPTRVRFYGESGSTFLSASKESTIRSFSLEAEFLDSSLGKAMFNKKKVDKGAIKEKEIMPPVVEFFAEPAREADWNNIVAIREGMREVITSNYRRGTTGMHFLLHERFQKNLKVVPTCVHITACGNFCLIGYSTGHVDRFNLQSSIHRQTYGKRTAHDGPVSAVASDSMVLQVVTAGTIEIKFWNFKTGVLSDTLKTESPVTSMVTYRDNSLTAAALQNFDVVIVDMDTHRIIRSFHGHRGTITDMAFSPDSKWLISASKDLSIRVWDLSTANMVDSFKVPSVCLSLTFSPTGEYLASCHEDNVGISLWTNKSIYAPTTLRALDPDSEPEMLRLPGSASGSDEIIPLDDEPMEESYKSPEQLIDKFLTLSLLPDYRWKNLARQDLIRERNKPKEALKLPEKAPFFLPTVPGLEPTFDLKASAGASDKNKEKPRRVFSGSSSPFQEALMAEDAVYDVLLGPLNLLGHLSISQIETEFRKLAPDAGGSLELLRSFAQCLVAALEDGRNQEIIQSYLELFLKLHMFTVIDEHADESLLRIFGQLREKVSRSVNRSEQLLDQSLSVVTFLKHVAL